MLALLLCLLSDLAPPPDCSIGPPTVTVRCYVFREAGGRYYLHFNPEVAGDRRPWVVDGGAGVQEIAAAAACIGRVWLTGEWVDGKFSVQTVRYSEGP